MALENIIKAIDEIEKNKQQAISENTNVPLNTSNTVLKEATSIPLGVAMLSTPESFSTKEKQNFILSQQKFEGEPIAELATDLITGGITEFGFRRPLSSLVKKLTERVLEEDISKGIGFGLSSTAESALWSIPQSLELNKNGDIAVNKEALTKGTIYNLIPATALGFVKLTEEKTANKIKTKKQKDDIKNMISFDDETPKYKEPVNKTNLDNEILFDAINDNDADTIQAYMMHNYGDNVNVHIGSFGKDTEPAWIEIDKQGNKKIILNKDNINKDDDIDTILSHELTHSNAHDNNLVDGSDYNIKLNEFFAYADSINKSDNIDKKTRLLNDFINRYAKDFKNKDSIDNKLVTELYNLATNKKSIDEVLNDNKYLINEMNKKNMTDFVNESLISDEEKLYNESIYNEPIDNKKHIEDNYKTLDSFTKRKLNKAFEKDDIDSLEYFINDIASKNGIDKQIKIKIDNTLDKDAELKLINNEPTLVLNRDKISRLKTNIGSIVEDEILNSKTILEPTAKRGYNKFRNNIIEHFINRDDIDINKVKINNKKLQNDFDLKTKTYLTNLYKETIKVLKNPNSKVSEEALNLASLIKDKKISIDDFKKSFKITKNELNKEFKEEPTRLAKIDINNEYKAYIDDINKDEILSMLLHKNNITGELNNKKLELKENYIARKIEKENEPRVKNERIQEQKEKLETYLKKKSESKQKIKKVKLNKKENEVTKYMKKLIDYFQKDNPKFKDKRIEKLYNQYKNDIDGLKKKLNEDYKIIAEVTKKHPEIFFNKDGSLDKEFFIPFITRANKVTAKDIISKYEELLQKQAKKVKTIKQRQYTKEPMKRQIGSNEKKQKEQTNKGQNKQDKKQTREPTENKQKQEKSTINKEKHKNKFRDYEYWNMLYSTKNVKLTTNHIKDLFHFDIKNNIKVFESMDLDKIKDAYNKLGVAIPNKKEAYASGGSKPIHLVALVHEFVHNLNPKLSEKQVVGLTANTILKLLKQTKGLKEKFEINDEFIKELEKQSKLYKNDKSVDAIIRHIAGNKELKNIIFGNQSLWSKWIKADQMVSDLLTKGMKKIIGSEKIKEFKELFDKKAPTTLKHILFEANLLEPEEAVNKLIELKKRINVSKDEFKKALEIELDSIKKHISDEELNKIIDSGIIQLRTLLDEPNIIDKVKSFNLKKLNKYQLKLIKDNIDFRFIDKDNEIKVKNKLDYLNNKKIKKLIDKYFGSFENYALARSAYILKDIPKEKLEKIKDIIEMYHNIQSKVLDKNLLILGYKPYIIKTLSTLKVAKNDLERIKLLNKGYEEVEPYIFKVPYVDKDLESLFFNIKSTNKKTGLTFEVSSLKEVPKALLKRATILKITKDDKTFYRISVFPKKETFDKIYATIEPKEMFTVSYDTLLDKYLNRKLSSLADFKDNLKQIVKSIDIKDKSIKNYNELSPEFNYVYVGDVANQILNKIFNTKNKVYFIKKDYKDFLLYEEKLPENEKLAQYVKIYKSLIKRLKGNLTYKSPTAFMSNLLSGITASMYLGVNPRYIPKLVMQTLKEYKEWKKYEKKYARMISKYGIEKARKWLKTVKKNNVFAEMIYDGKIGSLHNEASVLYGSTHDDKALLSALKKIDNKLGTNNAEKILTMIKSGLLDKETIIGSYLANMYSNIDLFSRAVMYKYLKPNIGKEEAIKQINNILVDFRREPIGSIKDIEYTAIPFLTFFLRMQGGILKTIQKHPLSVGLILLSYYLLSDKDNDDYIGNIRTDSFFLHRMLADPLILELSIPAQLYQGKFDKLVENTLLPRLYIKAYESFYDNNPFALLGISEKPYWLK